MNSISYNSLSLGALGRIGLIANVSLWMPLSVCIGVLGAFGLATVKWNGAAVTGLPALFAGVLIGVVMSLAGSALMLIGAAMSRVFKRWLQNQSLTCDS